jgi:serine phosphatase RsbU (regulator of sigma subunit)
MEDQIGRILVVDDNEMNRDMLSRRVKRQGHIVSTADDGVQALEVLRREPFDVVLLDIMMPNMNGYEVLEQLKADAELRNVRVIMISALTEIDSVVKCLELGADDYLPKPFNPVVLRARLKSSLAGKLLRDQEQMFAKSMEKELDIGRQIQAGFFPESIPPAAGWDIQARFQAARQVAGDFYDVFPMPDGRLGLVVADVCDKGVGAALFMALFRSLLRASADERYFHPNLEAVDSTGPDGGRKTLLRAVELTNNYIAQTHGSANMFATIFFGVLDLANGDLDFINGGHESPMILSGGEVKETLEPSGPAVGLMPDMSFEICSTRLDPGDTLLGFTDGVSEAMNAEAEEFGVDRLVAAVAASDTNAEALLQSIEAQLADHVGEAEQWDDITMLAVRRLA